jgi:hypothetical protein
MYNRAERKLIHTNGKFTMGKFKSSLFFNDLRGKVFSPFVDNGGIIDHHYRNFLCVLNVQSCLLLCVLSVQL